MGSGLRFCDSSTIFLYDQFLCIGEFAVSLCFFRAALWLRLTFDVSRSVMPQRSVNGGSGFLLVRISTSFAIRRY